MPARSHRRRGPGGSVAVVVVVVVGAIVVRAIVVRAIGRARRGKKFAMICSAARSGRLPLSDGAFLAKGRGTLRVWREILYAPLRSARPCARGRRGRLPPRSCGIPCAPRHAGLTPASHWPHTGAARASARRPRGGSFVIHRRGAAVNQESSGANRARRGTTPAAAPTTSDRSAAGARAGEDAADSAHAPRQSSGG